MLIRVLKRRGKLHRSSLNVLINETASIVGFVDHPLLRGGAGNSSKGPVLWHTVGCHELLRLRSPFDTHL